MNRIAICGIHIEASTFTPHRSGLDVFNVTRGQQLLDRYPFLKPGMELAEAAEWVGILHAGALPGGAVLAETYAELKDEIVTGLRAQGPFDAVFFDIHGAMSVVGMTDAEVDLLDAVRGVVGDVPISTSMDLHGNVSEALFAGSDLLTCYRTAPHVDVWETRERAVRNLLEVLASGRRPAKALVHVPVLLPGEMTSTRLEPALSLYERVGVVAEREGVIDAAVWIGFAWADEDRCCGAVVVTGWDEQAVREGADELGTLFWRSREGFEFVAPTGPFDECLETALTSDQRPFFLSDSGDNPGAGGADDVTVTLAALAGRPEIHEGRVTALLASIVDPAASRLAHEVGVGQSARFELGGHIDTREPGSQLLEMEVAQLSANARGGRVALLRQGGLHVIVTERRDQYAELEQYLAAGIDPATMDIVVVKMGYLEPDLFALQQGWLLTLTPGGVDQDIVRLPYQQRRRPLFPFEDVSGHAPVVQLVPATD